MIYTSVYFTMIYKDSQKLEKTRKYRKPMPHNQGVPGSSPGGTSKRSSTDSVEERLCFIAMMQYRNSLLTLRYHDYSENLIFFEYEETDNLIDDLCHGSDMRKCKELSFAAPGRI